VWGTVSAQGRQGRQMSVTQERQHRVGQSPWVEGHLTSVPASGR
jgi:hypothetical protein